MIRSKPIIHALMLSALCFSSPALAEKGGRDHGRGHDKHDKHDSRRDDRHDDRYDRYDDRYDSRRDRIIIHDNDRMVIRRYITEHHYPNCSPGLAKKHNGCRPPGHAQRYVIGQPLPSVLVWQQVPRPLLVQLQPAPRGYQYVMVDQDVLLVSEASHHVIDAITLLSAVGY